MNECKVCKIGKKGMNYFWVGLLVVIIGAIVVLLFYKLYSESLEGTIGSADCKTALALIAGAQKIRITNFVDLTSHLKKACKPTRIVIDKEDFDEANKKIADAMLDCALLGEKYFSPILPGGIWNAIKGYVSGDWWLVNFKCADIVFTERGAKNYRKKGVNADTFGDWIKKYKIGKDKNLGNYFEKDLEYVMVWPNLAIPWTEEKVYTLYLSTFVISEAEYNNLKDKGISLLDIISWPITLPSRAIRIVGEWFTGGGLENAYRKFYGNESKRLSDIFWIHCILEPVSSYNKRINNVSVQKVQKLNF